jgi:hypothetical protein
MAISNIALTLSETEIGGAILDARVTTRFIAAAHADEGPAIFYVDGHYLVTRTIPRPRDGSSM